MTRYKIENSKQMFPNCDYDLTTCTAHARLRCGRGAAIRDPSARDVQLPVDVVPTPAHHLHVRFSKRDKTINQRWFSKIIVPENSESSKHWVLCCFSKEATPCDPDFSKVFSFATRISKTHGSKPIWMNRNMNFSQRF